MKTPCNIATSPTAGVLTCHKRKSQVPVRISNTTDKPITVRPGDIIGEARAVTWITQPGQNSALASIEDNSDAEQHSEAKFSVSGVQFDMTSANLTSEQLLQVKKMFTQEQDVFSKGENDLGTCGLERHRIRLTDDTPISERHRRVPPAMYNELKTVLQGMVDSGVIRESHSPWAAPIVIVEVKYLGHIVSKEGVKTDPEKTKALKTWPVPTSAKEVKTFLGVTGYFRRYVKGFSKVAKPLNDLTVGLYK
ncbi:uncharacterized protein [Ptychodera flava]|uniref:uncharacterized protein n=1 Tax=Ptychodera flava TaxID=63121 RepID=UPI00396A5C5F